VSIAAFEALAVATILPETVREIGGLEWYGWAFTGFMLANLAGIPLAGDAADRTGPAPPFAAGLLCFAGGLAVAGLARSMPVLVAGRVLQGLGAAALSSVSYVAVARAYPASAQPRMMALLSSAWVVPGLIGPAIAAGVARQWGWRFVFIGLAPSTLLAGALALPGLRSLAPAASLRDDQASTPVRDAALLALAVALTLIGGSEAGVPAALVALVGATLALRQMGRLLPTGTLRARPGLPAAVAALGLVNFAFFAVEAFLPLALTEVRGADTTLVAAALTAGTLCWTAGSWIQARAAARVRRRPLLRGGLACLLAGVVAASAILSPALPPAAVVAAWGLAGIGIGVAYPTGTLAVLEAAPKGREGQASAAMQIANALAIAIGTGFGAALLARFAPAASPALGIGAVDVLSVAACGLALVAARGVAEPRGDGALQSSSS